MINNVGNQIRNAVIGVAAVGALLGIGHMERLREKNKDMETQRQISSTYQAIGKSLDLVKGTNNELSLESGQDFLNSQGIDYKLGTNEVMTLDISMGNNWQSVYVGIRNKNAQGGGIIPGITTLSNLQNYINSHQR